MISLAWSSEKISIEYQDCFGFASRHKLIGPGTSRHFFNQSDLKLKPIVTRSLAFSRAPETSRHFFNQSDLKLKPIATLLLPFSRAPGSLLIFTLNSHWFLVIFSFVLIFTTIIKCTIIKVAYRPWVLRLLVRGNCSTSINLPQLHFIQHSKINLLAVSWHWLHSFDYLHPVRCLFLASVVLFAQYTM